MNNGIIEISINCLIPHPDNPRFAVGDVTELAASLKAKGCLQNLTVVPALDKGKYLVVIGNRRLAAAKLAGLETLPCAVSDMNRQEQIETMLLENMQRSDLTYVEEAFGIQMMMDEFGYTIADIAEKTGLSYSTVRRRNALNKLDRDTLLELDKQVKDGSKQISLDDYLAVAELETDTAKNRALKQIGTNNFNLEMERIKSHARQMEYKAMAINVLQNAGYKPVHDASGLIYCSYYGVCSNPPELDALPDGAEGYYKDFGSYFYIYRSQSAKETEQSMESERRRAEYTHKQAEIDRRKGQLRTLAADTYSLRKKFVKEFYPNTRHIKTVVRFANTALLDVSEVDYDELADFGLVPNNDEFDIDELTYHEIDELASEKPLHALLCLAFSTLDSSYYNYDLCFEKNEALDYIYDTLCELGYEMSDTEKQLRDGTHELFGGVQ